MARFYGWVTAKVLRNSLKGETVYTNKLQCGDLLVTPCESKSVYKVTDLFIGTYQHLLCAWNPDMQVDACGGDSGGGLTVGGLLYGVVTGAPDYLCGRTVPFMDVCSYRTWIKKVTGV
ncbi:hypothetical protein AOLI_G00329760 [Acnodon oligacanthus]